MEPLLPEEPPLEEPPMELPLPVVPAELPTVLSPPEDWAVWNSSWEIWPSLLVSMADMSSPPARASCSLMWPSPFVSRLLNDCVLIPPLLPLMPLEALPVLPLLMPLDEPPLLMPLDALLLSLGMVLDWLLLAAKAGAAASVRMHARIVWCFICVLLDVKTM